MLDVPVGQASELGEVNGADIANKRADSSRASGVGCYIFIL